MDKDHAIEPIGGAGIFDIDPDQSPVSQDASDQVAGDLDALPADQEF